jgi:phage terminase Nu1 subunit (DNA packaging protein)
MASTLEKTPTLGMFKALELIAKGRVDDAAVAALVGDAVAATHAEVGRLLGVAANTIKQSWAPEGMPGTQGNYPLAAIVAWRLRYLAELEGRKQTAADLSNSELERQRAEEELRKIKLQNDKLEREEQIATGKVIDRESAGTAMRTAASVLAERLMKVPSQLEPSLPVEIAPDIVKDAERLIRRELVGFSETMARDILKQGTADD